MKFFRCKDFFVSQGAYSDIKQKSEEIQKKEDEAIGKLKSEKNKKIAQFEQYHHVEKRVHGLKTKPKGDLNADDLDFIRKVCKLPPTTKKRHCFQAIRVFNVGVKCNEIKQRGNAAKLTADDIKFIKLVCNPSATTNEECWAAIKAFKFKSNTQIVNDVGKIESEFEDKKHELRTKLATEYKATILNEQMGIYFNSKFDKGQPRNITFLKAQLKEATQLISMLSETSEVSEDEINQTIDGILDSPETIQTLKDSHNDKFTVFLTMLLMQLGMVKEVKMGGATGQ